MFSECRGLTPAGILPGWVLPQSTLQLDATFSGNAKEMTWTLDPTAHIVAQHQSVVVMHASPEEESERSIEREDKEAAPAAACVRRAMFHEC
jgi:hypothetical protein